jgi:hypothetical protein
VLVDPVKVNPLLPTNSRSRHRDISLRAKNGGEPTGSSHPRLRCIFNASKLAPRLAWETERAPVRPECAT